MLVSTRFHDATAIELYLGLDSRLRAIELMRNILLIPTILSHVWKGHISTSNPKTRKQPEKIIGCSVPCGGPALNIAAEATRASIS